MPNLPRFLAHFDQNYKIFATKLRFRIRRVVLERVFISKQNRSDQLFEFQTEEKIFPSWCRTNINKLPLRYHRRDLRCLQQSTCKHLQQQNHFLQAIQKLRLTFPCPKFSQKNLHDGSSDGRQKYPFTRSI